MPIAAPPDATVARRLSTVAAGLPLVSAGVALTIRAELGVAPYDVLSTGIVALTGLDIGIAAVVVPVAFVAIGLLLRTRPGPGTLVAVLLVGPVLGVVLDALPAQDAMAPRLAYFVAGFVLITAGITLVVVANMGPGPAELVMLAVHAKGYSLAPARTAIEAICVVLGWGMGGQVGLGTLVFAVLVGPALKRTLSITGFTARPLAATSDCASTGA